MSILAVVSNAAARELIVALDGELDMVSFEMIADLVGAGIEAGKPTLVLDLSAVRFIDLAGLHSLLDAKARSRAAGIQLVLRAPSERVVEFLKLVGVDSVFALERATP